jgi:DNA-binding MarR family transcriptional regulator
MTNQSAIAKLVPPGAVAPDLKLEQFLPYQLNVCANLVSTALSRIYAERYRIGVPEWRVLVTLGETEMMTAKAIGIHSHMHKTKVSRAVALLERRKLVARRVNRADLREAFLSLTPAGREIYSELAPSALEFARQMMEAIDPADRDAFSRALHRLKERSERITAEFGHGGAGNVAKGGNPG